MRVSTGQAMLGDKMNNLFLRVYKPGIIISEYLPKKPLHTPKVCNFVLPFFMVCIIESAIFRECTLGHGPIKAYDFGTVGAPVLL